MSKQSELFAGFIAEGEGKRLSPREERVAILIAGSVHIRAIAEEFQVTRERIRQIVAKAARRIQRIQRDEKSAKEKAEKFAALKAAFLSPLEIPIDDLDLPARLYLHLMNLGAEKLGDVVKLGSRGLWRGGGIGQVYTKMIEDALAYFGLKLPFESSKNASTEKGG